MKKTPDLYVCHQSEAQLGGSEVCPATAVEPHAPATAGDARPLAGTGSHVLCTTMQRQDLTMLGHLILSLATQNPDSSMDVG